MNGWTPETHLQCPPLCNSSTLWKRPTTASCFWRDAPRASETSPRRTSNVSGTKAGVDSFSSKNALPFPSVAYQSMYDVRKSNLPEQDIISKHLNWDVRHPHLSRSFMTLPIEWKRWKPRLKRVLNCKLDLSASMNKESYFVSDDQKDQFLIKNISLLTCRSQVCWTRTSIP